MLKFSRFASVTCALFFVCHASFAQDWYQIEVIAFEYNHPNQDQVELWVNHPGEPDWKSGINLTDEATAKSRRKQQQVAAAAAAPPPPPPPPPPAPVQEVDEDGNPVGDPVPAPAPPPPPPKTEPAKNASGDDFVPVEQILTGHHEDHQQAASNKEGPLPFVGLPSSQFTLGDIERKLHKQGTYRILTHTAWRQPAFTGNNTDSVHIFGGRVLDREGAAGERYEFEGLVALRLSRFLNLDVDALLREPGKTSSGGKFDSPADLGLLESKNHGSERMPIYQVYRLLQTQRVRNNKVYYFDHPLMGMIIKISPYGG